MNTIKTKLKSNRGASITFALLLFLVCAVISSVVIVAATAAAGRMSEQADMDERYYAVTAVASKLEKEIAAISDNPIKLQYIKTDNPEDIDISTVDVIESDGFTGIFAVASKGVLKKTPMTVSVNGGNVIKNADESVECTVTGILNADGTLVFTIKAQTVKANGKEIENGRTYSLELKFASTLQLSSTDSTETTATATVKWALLGAEKQRKDR